MMNSRPEAPNTPEETTDQDLVTLVRAGNSRAYGVLWARHSGSAYGVARSFPTLDADDLVSEAFVKVLISIQDGRGPESAFRPYITMTVRNLARSQFVRDPSMLDVDVEMATHGTPSGEELVIDGYERSTMLGAFHSLPTRWQEVLWHSEVEGLRPREVAQYLGIPANAVSALLIRAKKGLKEAWIAAHLATARTPECRATVRELGAYVAGGASKRTTIRVEQHLATCPHCTRALEEAQNAAHLTFALFPAVVGVTGVVGMGWQLASPPLPQALVALGVESYSDGGPEAVQPAAESTKHRSVALLALALVLLVAGSATTITFVTSSVFEVAPDGSASASTPTDDPSPSTESAPSTAPQVPLTPTPDPAVPDPLTTAVPPTSDLSSPPPVAPAPDASLPTTPDGSEGAPVNPPRPTDAPPPEAESPLSAPNATLSQSDERMYPVVTGIDAVAGATIRLLDERGGVVGTATAASDGSWRARIVEGASGTHTVRAQQALGDRVSPSSAALAYTTAEPPTVSQPAQGAVVTASRFAFSFIAEPGDVVQRQIVETSTVFTLRMPDSGIWNERMSTTSGTHVMHVRYADPATGDFGPPAVIEFTAR